MQPDKLVMMANQIATYFQSQPRTDQAREVADHLNDYWEPRMRTALARHAASGGAGLSPLAKDAMAYVRAPSD